MNLRSIFSSIVSLSFFVPREHPLVVKAKLIILDLEDARNKDPLINPNFHARCGVALNKELMLLNDQMDALKAREVYYLINHISMMIRTQQLRIVAAS